jgi:acyl-CoA thioester hydrolase
MGRPFRHRLRVRYGECDSQGVVFNPHYLAYYDVAITELWRSAIGHYGDMVEGGVDMVAAEASLRFVSPARFDDELELEVAVTRLGNTALSTRLRIRSAEQLVVEGAMRHVFVDAATKSKTPMPAEVRRALEPYLAAD